MGKGDQRLPGKMRSRVGDVGRQRHTRASWCVHVEQFPIAYTDASSDGAVGYNDIRHKNDGAQSRRTLM